MKKAFSLICTLSFALVAIADETSTVNYGTQTTTPPLPLIWHYRVETDGVITYAIIDGVRVEGGDNPTGVLAVPTSVVDENTDDAYVVKEIAAGTFANQIGLTSISIPVTVERIGTGVFNGCTVLAEISVDEDNPWYASAKGVLYDKDRAKLVACPARTEVVTLPAALTEIGEEAFATCHRLASLEIPASVETIGARAFLGCTRLSSISFAGNAPTATADIIQGANPSLIFTKKDGSTGWDAAPWNGLNVQTAESGQPSGIVSASFGNIIWRYRVINGEAEIYGGGSAAIPTSTIQTYSYDPDTFMWIPDGKLDIPSSLGGYPVTHIGDYAFSGCSALTEVVIPQTIRHIGDYAFANCTGITDLTLPSGVQSIGYHPFYGSAITSLALPDSLRKLDGNPLAGCDTILSVSLSTDNSYYAVVNGILYDKDVAMLVGCPARKESVSIASTATRIGPEAFDGCFRLRAILLPEALDSVGTKAFRGTIRLSSIVFPASVTRLEGAGLFEGCTSLEFVGFAGNAPAVDPAIFAGTQGTLSIYVSQGTTGWKDATPALPDSGTWPTADANGRAIANLDVSAEAELKEGDIFVGITTNGTDQYAYTLKVLANKGIEILGISPKPIGSFNVPSDFGSSLGTLTVKSLGPQLFANAIGLLSVTVPNAVTNIGNEVFKNCSSLETVTLAHGLRVIGRHPFAGTAIEKITLPDTVSTIDGNPIYGCDPSVSISVGANNPYFSVSSEGALYDKDFTTLFAVPMTTEELTVPASVTALEDEAFAGCIRLKKITFEGNAPTAADDIFADTSATMTSYVGATATGFTTGTWKNRPIVTGEENTDSNTDGTWIWVVENAVAKLYNNGESAFVDTNYSGAVSIPAEVTDSASGKKYTVAAIGDRAMYGCKYVTSATIPSTIQSIGSEPFGGTRIATLAIPAYVESIAGNPAAGCTRFTGFTVDAANIHFSADAAGMLYDAAGATLLAVPARAAEIYIPESVTAIANDAFAGCTILAKVNFIGNAPTAADTIFADTPATMTSYAQASASGFSGDTWKGRPLVITGGAIGPTDRETIGGLTWYYRVVDGVAEIWRDGKTAVESDSPITTIALPAVVGGYQVKGIGACALADLRGITTISVPDTYEWIGDSALSNCTSLASVTLAHGLRTIGRHPFEGTAIETIDLPDTVSAIDGNPIYGCAPSVSLSVGANNPYFSASSEGALYDKDFTTLFAVPMTTEELTVPASVTALEDEAFAGCIRLKKITFEGNAPTAADDIFADTSATMTSYVGASATGFTTGTWKNRPIVTGEENTDSNTDGTWIWVVENAVAKLYNNGDSAFVDTNYSGTVSIPAEVTDSASGKKYTVAAIGDRAMYGCKYVTSATIPSTIQSIGSEPFGGTRIATLAIPAYVESIAGNPAAGCTRFTGFTVDAANIHFSADAAGMLYDASGATLLAVPARAGEIYIPESVTAIANDAFAGCTILSKVNFIGNAPTAADTIFADTPVTMTSYAQASASGFSGDTWKGRPLVITGGAIGPTDRETIGGLTWYYRVVDGVAEIWRDGKTAVESDSPITTIALPAVVGGYQVKGIGVCAFADLRGITTISVPDTYEWIGDSALSNCTSLASVTLAHGLRTIGRHPFEGTAIETIDLPDTVSAIDGNPIYGCAPSVSLSVGDNNPYFAESAEGALYDKGFTTLYAVPMTTTALTVPKTTTAIDDEAFAGCILLTKVTFLGNAPSAADDIFADTPTTLEITVEEGSLGWDGDQASSAIPASGLWRNRAITLHSEPPTVDSNTDGTWKWTVNGGVATLYNDGKSALLDTNHNGAVSVPTEVTDSATGNKYTVVGLGDRAMYGCKYVTAVTLPSTILSIGAEPFGGTRIATLAIPAYVESIDGNPAAGCTRFTGFAVDAENINFATDNAGCLYDYQKTALLAVPARATEVTIPPTVTTIADDAFAGCTILAKATFEGNAPTAADDVFADTPATMTSYAREGVGFPSGTWKNRPIVLSNVNGATIDYTEGGITWHCRIVEDGIAEIMSVESESAITSLTLPTTIGNLVIKGIGDSALANLRGITAINLPQTYEWIGDGAFSNCTSLAAANLGSGLRVIGRHPFAGTAIETIALPDTVSSIDGNPIYGCDPSVSISVGANNPYFSVSSEGALYDKDFTTLFAVPMTAEELTVPASVAAISDEAFAGCIRLKKLTFEGNAPTAADDVFADTPATMTSHVSSSATGFTTDTWKSRPIVVGAGNIDSNTDGTWIWVVENDVAKLYNNGESAFVDTNYSGAVSIPAEVTDSGSGKKYTVAAIGDHALYGCKYVTSASIPSTIQSIGAEPFGGTRIATLAIPAYVESIDGNPAAGCTRFTGFAVDAENINFATDNAGCLYDYQKTTLLAVPARATEVTIPATVTTIADDAFAGCTILAKATFEGNAPTAADGIFADTPELLKITVLTGSTGWDGNPESDTPPTSGLWRDRQIFADDSRSINQEYDDGTVKWTYDIAKGKAVITGASGEAEVVTVPATLGEHKVSTINADALDGLSGVKEFKSESDLYKTKNGCLYSADGKTLIRVPDSLVLPYSVTTEVSSKIVTVTIVPGLKDSGNPGNDGTSITTNITSISTSRNREKVDGDISFDELLSGVTAIADHAFYGCNSNLTNNYASTSENLSGETGFIGTSGNVYVRRSTKVISTSNIYETTLALPATITTIGTNAFEGSAVVPSRTNTSQQPTTDDSSLRQEPIDNKNLQLAESSRYIGWIEQSGKIVGTVTVKTGKARNGVIKTSGSVVKIGAKKTKIKSMSELSAIDGLTLVKDLSASKSDATAFNAFKGKCWTVALMTSNSNAALLDGYTTLSIAIQAKGKVRIAGTATDGTKISASAQMVVDGDTFKIPVAAQLYSGKRGGFATVFTVTEEGEISVDGTSVAFTAILNGAPVHISLLTIDSAPRGNALSGDISIWGAGNDEYSLAENLGWKPRYTKSSGQFKGKLYLIRNSDMKRVRATVTGVVANEIGYGTAVVKGVRSLKVEVK